MYCVLSQSPVSKSYRTYGYITRLINVCNVIGCDGRGIGSEGRCYLSLEMLPFTYIITILLYHFRGKLVPDVYAVLGHQDVKSTSCPGTLFYLDHVQQMINYVSVFSNRGRMSNPSLTFNIMCKSPPIHNKSVSVE